MSKYFICTTNKTALTYRTEEEITFTIEARENFIPISCKYVAWELSGDDGKKSKGLGVCTTEKPLVLSTSCERPGFVHLKCVAMLPDGIPDIKFESLDASAGVNVEKMSYYDTLPSDYEQYWSDIRQMISDFTPKLLQNIQLLSEVPKEFLTYDIRISTPIETSASGYLTIPKKKGKYPITLVFNGYGVDGSATPIYEKDMITFFINAHGIENGRAKVELMYKYTNLERYGFDEEENKSPYTTYWRSVMIRDLTAAKFAQSLPQWNGKCLIAKGSSQGAFQATTIAAQDLSVSKLEISVPWFCNLRAGEHGYQAGWSGVFSEGLRYFDTVAQGIHIRCPVQITAYLGDYICPPSAIMALYNSIKAPKSIEFIQGGTHGNRPLEITRFPLWHNEKGVMDDVCAGIYRKSDGSMWKVLSSGKNETGESVVIYKSVNSDIDDVYVCPEYLWHRYVVQDGEVVLAYSMSTFKSDLGMSNI